VLTKNEALSDEGRLVLLADGPAVLAQYSSFPRALETYVAHARGVSTLLLEFTPLGTAHPGRPWRDFDFLSTLLEQVQSLAVVGEERSREFLVELCSLLCTEAVVRFFPVERRQGALDWLAA
jgi:hypothetical protein